jgi:Astacin (Peptidase family M12A)
MAKKSKKITREREIEEIFYDDSSECDATCSDGDSGDEPTNFHACLPKSLPIDLQIDAAATARGINPVNSPAMQMGTAADILPASKIAILTTKYWGAAARTLSVQFLEGTSNELKNKILSYMNRWQIGIKFALTNGVGHVRISRGAGGYYSYLGTDILHIAQGRQTMNLQGFTVNTSDSEYDRVVTHETGHTLGFPHEHMRRELVARIDRNKAYAYFARNQGWDRQTVDQQVLTPLDDNSLFRTPVDQDSIMCYQLPGEITRDGLPIRGGKSINPTDRKFAQKIYPPVSSAPQMAPGEIDLGVARGMADYDPEEFVRTPMSID